MKKIIFILLFSMLLSGCTASKPREYYQNKYNEYFEQFEKNNNFELISKTESSDEDDYYLEIRIEYFNHPVAIFLDSDKHCGLLIEIPHESKIDIDTKISILKGVTDAFSKKTFSAEKIKEAYSDAKEFDFDWVGLSLFSDDYIIFIENDAARKDTLAFNGRIK